MLNETGRKQSGLHLMHSECSEPPFGCDCLHLCYAPTVQVTAELGGDVRAHLLL